MIRSDALAAALLASSLTGPGNHAQPAPTQQTAPADDEADARAILNARLAALRTVIEMSPEQEKLWTLLEAAIRDASRNAAASRTQRLVASEPTTFLEMLGRIADAEAACGQDLRRFVDNATPFVASLTNAQRHRIADIIPAWNSSNDDVGNWKPGLTLTV
ncbi:Spy/CpxP family protein refolding chaperone [Roseomonas gilardii]|uniref:Spy/CpxP family protein refolding chaperone n=1 Tax=Roseomonas gilardii TaxID=257708 RepID=UPI0004B5C1FC|nr:Spy/CpxP family protein refolding chaperone [Roseomonas gilardii]